MDNSALNTEGCENCRHTRSVHCEECGICEECFDQDRECAGFITDKEWC